MRLIVDKEARQVIEGMCDISLKAGGLQNLRAVSQILANIEDFVEDPAADEAAKVGPTKDSKKREK